MLGSSLRRRIEALERDIEQAIRDRRLESRWQRELAAAREQLIHIDHTMPLPIRGVDYSWSRPPASSLRRHGYMFACRYLTGGGKALQHPEAATLTAHGLSIVSIFEEQAQAMLGGEAAGRQDGALAAHAARLLGMPPHRPIYFACDFDIQDEQLPTVLAYMHGTKEVMDGRYYAGGYGGLRFTRAIKNAGYTYAWQTLAWSGGEWDTRAQLRQIAVGTPTIDGAECDTNFAYAPDYGQWKL